MTIRIATPADVAGMFEVRTRVRENHISLAELAELGITPDSLPAMLSGSGRGWVACDEGRVVAFAMADASDATLFALFVRQSHEGKGLGRQLMQAAESWLGAQGCHEIWLLTDADTRVRANGFYRHLGWLDDGIQDDGQVRFTKLLSGST
ncbi:N-acetyltransferase family protein [Aeromonas lusitana]|uniref:GNAT family N-acetyltransferase n=1 Tax=Aeromonas lusitana TaxID=931529 RepID=A0A2M8H7T8_9GAMM|nr:GNAT family N-acetyltransferase [Aeromonas lusitana]PJC92616.1 GNAT family N-acetyltransferase [Aeromonas lusitana]